MSQPAGPNLSPIPPIPSDAAQPGDEQLIAAANAGDAAAFAQLYLRYRDGVVRLAMRFTGNADDALDVLQDVFAYFLGKFPGFELTASLTTFFYPAVKNLSLALLRKKHRRIGGEEMLACQAAPAALQGGASRAELAAVITSLAPAMREVVLMRFVDAMSLEQIAQALTIPLGTVKSRLHNALQMLRGDAKLANYFLEK